MRLDHLLSERKAKKLCVQSKEKENLTETFLFLLIFLYIGDIAQLARASALQAEGQGFEPPYLHKRRSGDAKLRKVFETNREGKKKR